MIAGRAIALLMVAGAVDLPRAPCAAQLEVQTALKDAQARGPEALEAQLSALEGLLDFPLLGGVGPKDPARVELALGRLASLCALRATPAPMDNAPEVDAARLQEILSRPEFDGARNRKGDAFAALLRRALEWLTALFSTQEMETGAKGIRFLVLALAAGLAIFGLLRLRNARFGGRRRAGGDAAASGPLVLDDPSAHLARAREALGEDARRAIREGLLALLSTLERQRWARPDRVKTNRELAQELPGRGAPAEATRQVEALVRWYDQTFYSLAPVPPDEARRFVDEVAAFEDQVAAGAAR